MTTNDLLHNISSCVSSIKHAVMLRVGWTGCELEFPPEVNRSELCLLFMFPFGLQVIFLSTFSAREVWLSFHCSRSETTRLFMSCTAGECSGDILKKRDGTSCRAPAGSHIICIQSLFSGERLGLGANELICRQNNGITALHWNKTVSVSYKANEVQLKGIISRIILLSG